VYKGERKMNVLTLETIVLRALTETEFAKRLLADVKAAVSEYHLGEPEMQAVNRFAGKLSLNSDGTTQSPESEFHGSRTGWI
jgi:hypothetical protein